MHHHGNTFSESLHIIVFLKFHFHTFSVADLVWLFSHVNHCVNSIFIVALFTHTHFKVFTHSMFVPTFLMEILLNNCGTLCAFLAEFLLAHL